MQKNAKQHRARYPWSQHLQIATPLIVGNCFLLQVIASVYRLAAILKGGIKTMASTHPYTLSTPLVEPIIHGSLLASLYQPATFSNVQAQHLDLDTPDNIPISCQTSSCCHNRLALRLFDPRVRELDEAPADHRLLSLLLDVSRLPYRCHRTQSLVEGR